MANDGVPSRIKTAFQVLQVTDTYQQGLYMGDTAENVIPPRLLNGQEAGARNAALETITRYLLGDLECVEKVGVLIQGNQAIFVPNSEIQGVPQDPQPDDREPRPLGSDRQGQ